MIYTIPLFHIAFSTYSRYPAFIATLSKESILSMKKLATILIIIPLLAQCGKQKKNEPLTSNFFQQASLEAQQGNPKKALNLVDKSIEYKSTHKALLLKATLLYSINELNVSVALFKKIINDKKTPPAMKADALNNYASVLYDMGNHDQADEIWNSLGVNKDYLSPELAYFNLGLVHLRRATNIPDDSPEYFGELEKAERRFKQALTISKYYTDALFYLGQIYIRRNQLQQARNTLIDLLIESPEHELAKNLLLRIEKQLNA